MIRIRFLRWLALHTKGTSVQILTAVTPLALTLTKTGLWERISFLTTNQKNQIELIIINFLLIIILLFIGNLYLRRWRRFGDIRERRHQVVIDGFNSGIGLLENGYSDERAQKFLISLSMYLKNHFHPQIAWIDVMHAYEYSEMDDLNCRYLLQGRHASDQWLIVVASEVSRSGVARAIPVQIDGRPFRGSGTAFISNGINYVDDTTKRIPIDEYNIKEEEKAAIKKQYLKWKRNDDFASLITCAIPKKNENGALGVINLHFRKRHPFGRRNTLSPEDRLLLHAILEPHQPVLRELALN